MIARTLSRMASNCSRNVALPSISAHLRSNSQISSSFKFGISTGRKKLKNARSYDAISSKRRTDAPTIIRNFSVLSNFRSDLNSLSGERFFLRPAAVEGNSLSKLSTRRRMRLPRAATRERRPSMAMATLRSCWRSSRIRCTTSTASGSSSSSASATSTSSSTSRRVRTKYSSSRS